MTVIFILIGCSLVLALIFLGAFFWSIKNGQNDDLVTPGYRMLFDEEEGNITDEVSITDIKD